MRFWFNRKQPEPELTPMERLEAAVDELNEALQNLPTEQRHIRPYVQSGSVIHRTRPKLMLGFWDQGGRSFVVTYGDD